MQDSSVLLEVNETFPQSGIQKEDRVNLPWKKINYSKFLQYFIVCYHSINNSRQSNKYDQEKSRQ